MQAPEVQFLLVIPAYCERWRLPPYLAQLIPALAAAEFSSALLVVDDGSPAEEQLAVRQTVRPGRTGNCEVLPPLLLAENRGKGAAILAGWRSDGAGPAAEVARVLAMIAGGGTAGAETCWWAARTGAAGHEVRRRPLRWLLGRLFAALVRLLLDRKIRDSQCGFKVVPGQWFRRVDGRLAERGFCFDLELLLALRDQGARVVEVPIDWRDQAGGSIRPLRDGWSMLRGVFRLRRKFRRRAWRQTHREPGDDFC
jgi:dolichyl-phosphate beta-glucosyltransferase